MFQHLFATTVFPTHGTSKSRLADLKAFDASHKGNAKCGCIRERNAFLRFDLDSGLGRNSPHSG
jgi:hypothetical protein